MFADGITSAAYVLYGIFKTNRTIGSIFTSSPNWNGNYDFQFQGVRTAQFRAWLAPYAPNRYYRSVIGNLSLSAATIRGS